MNWKKRSQVGGRCHCLSGRRHCLSGGWLDSDDKAISVQLNLTGTGTGTELGKIFNSTQCDTFLAVPLLIWAVPLLIWWVVIIRIKAKSVQLDWDLDWD